MLTRVETVLIMRIALLPLRVHTCQTRWAKPSANAPHLYSLYRLKVIIALEACHSMSQPEMPLDHGFEGVVLCVR
jgi:hypothetical protein